MKDGKKKKCGFKIFLFGAAAGAAVIYLAQNPDKVRKLISDAGSYCRKYQNSKEKEL